MFRLDNKVALVTGATHGLGMAIATALAEAGAKLVVNDISAEKLALAKDAYKANGIDVYTYLCDVTNEEDVIKTVEKIKIGNPIIPVKTMSSVHKLVL